MSLISVLRKTAQLTATLHLRSLTCVMNFEKAASVECTATLSRYTDGSHDRDLLDHKVSVLVSKRHGADEPASVLASESGSSIGPSTW